MKVDFTNLMDEFAASESGSKAQKKEGGKLNKKVFYFFKVKNFNKSNVV